MTQLLGLFFTKNEAIKDSIVANDKALDDEGGNKNRLEIQIHTKVFFNINSLYGTLRT